MAAAARTFSCSVTGATDMTMMSLHLPLSVSASSQLSVWPGVYATPLLTCAPAAGSSLSSTFSGFKSPCTSPWRCIFATATCTITFLLSVEQN